MSNEKQRTGGSAAGSDGHTPRPRSGPVVISSLTGKPMDWPQDDETQDKPEPRNSQSNDARIAGDVPPHWGRGR